MIRLSLLFALCTFLPASVLAAADAVTLVANGASAAVILYPAQAQADETLAVTELTGYLKKISGAEVPARAVTPADLTAALATVKADKRVPIVIGTLALTPARKAEIHERGNDPASFLLAATRDDGIAIAGLSAEGTLFGAFELLEQLGVRWFMPGELGTVVPKRATVALPAGVTLQVPSFGGRHCGGDATWTRHMRHGGPYFPSSHGVDLGREAAFDKHPEYYALVNGKRAPNQLCVSNPEVVALATRGIKAYFKANPTAPWVGMGPNDGSGFCECANCRALDAGDWDAFSNERSVTDRYIWLYNQILDGIKDECPGKKICFYSYHTYMRPPLKVKPNPLIVPAMAPIALCRIHSMNNPVCPEKSYLQSLYAGWKKVLPEVYDRGYWFNLADPGFPFMMISRLREEIPMEKALGIAGLRVETVNNWASESPSLYIASKLMWNADADVDQLLQDYADNFFGPASKPMLEYIRVMDAALRDGDYHAGCSFDLPHLYTAPIRARAGTLLAQAAKAAGGGVHGQRVALFRQSFDYLNSFIAMLNQQNAFRFNAAKAELDRCDALVKSLLACTPPMLNPNTTVPYMKRFFRQTTEQGYARTTGGNTLVAGFKDEWEFLTDPLKTGEDTGLWNPANIGGGWQRLKTSSLSWSAQGLRMYKGHAWYRQAVEIPAHFAGKRIFLWFGGVDEQARVWVNGKLVGISHQAAMLPFEFDATDAVVIGGKNTVTVQLKNETVDELGTGGILFPVMFYAPVAKDAKPENVYPLSPTFP